MMARRSAQICPIEHADRVARPGVLDDPRRGAGAALELVAVHAGPAADGSLLDPAAGRGLDRVDAVLLGDVVAVGIVEVAMPGFRRDRKRPVIAEFGMVADGPGDDSRMREPDR